jgi:hypothetical protein
MIDDALTTVVILKDGCGLDCVGAFGFVDPDPRPFPRCATIVDLEN